MLILCINHSEKTYYKARIYDDMFFDTKEAFKLANIEVIEYSKNELNRLKLKVYKEI